jgi:hypothetical protein
MSSLVSEEPVPPPVFEDEDFNRHGSGHETSESSSKKGRGVDALYRTLSSIKQKFMRPPLSML